MDPDVVVVGSGPNGLFAACRLARAGLSVLVLERHPERAGGAAVSEESTLPGFVHDVGAGFVAFHDSDAFRGLALERHGLRWTFGEYDSAHPGPDGSCAAISRDLPRTVEAFGPDGEAWRALATWHRTIDGPLMQMMRTLPPMEGLWRLGPIDGLKLARIFASRPAAFARRTFRTEAARRVLPGMGMHVDLGPEDPIGAPLGYVLSMRAGTAGFAVAEGGTGSITRALLADLRAHGGEVRLGSPVDRIAVRNGRAEAVIVRGGLEIRAREAVVADTSAPALLLGLLEGAHVPGFVKARMRRFPMGWGTFKVDAALSGPIPWRSELARRSAVVHAGDSLDDLQRTVEQVRRCELPDHPYLVVGQQSLADPTRAPDGQHTLYAYARVPRSIEGGWEAWRERYADVIDARIEELAPGYRALVQARTVRTPDDLEAANPNLIGGDLGGGSNQWYRQAILRPMFPYFRYRMHVSRLYLCSSYTHPGAGVHGMCGWNAAGIVLRDVGSKPGMTMIPELAT